MAFVRAGRLDSAETGLSLLRAIRTGSGLKEMSGWDLNSDVDLLGAAVPVVWGKSAAARETTTRPWPPSARAFSVRRPHLRRSTAMKLTRPATRARCAAGRRPTGEGGASIGEALTESRSTATPSTA